MDESSGNWHRDKNIKGLPISILFFLFFAFLLLNCPSVEAGTAFVSEGHTQMSNQRKIIANEHGFWVFFSSNPTLVSNPPGADDQYVSGSYPDQDASAGGGGFMVSYSADGLNWGSPTEIFPDRPDAFRCGSVAYDPTTKTVWAITGTRRWSYALYFTKATLNQGGTPSWGSIKTTTNLNEGTSSTSENVLAMGYVTICKVAGGDYVAYASPIGDGLDDDDRKVAFSFVDGNLGSFASYGQLGGNIDDAHYYDDAVILPADSSTQLLCMSDAGDASGDTIESDLDIYGSIRASPADYGEATQTGDKQLNRNNEYHTISAVADGNYEAHIVHPSITNGYLYYRRYTDSAAGSAVPAGTDIGNGTTANRNPSIGKVKYGDGSEKLIVVYVNSSGELYAVESDTFTTSAPSSWDSPYLWKKKIEDTYENLFPICQEETTSPNPLCVVWSAEDGNVYFDRIAISTNPAPSITSITPSTAPFNAKQFDITVNGSGFDNSGTGITANFVLASDTDTVASVDQIKISSVTYNGTSEIVLTASLGDSIPTGGGNYKIVVNNPDARSSSASSDTFTVLAPIITTINPLSGGQTAQRTITINGSNFQIWGSTKPTVSFGAGVTFSSCTYISSSQIQATINIAANATGDTRDVRLTNCDGQLSNILVDSFTVTAPQVSISTPAANGDIDIQTQLLDISGTASVVPATPATALGAEVRIRRQFDDYCWNGISFEEELGSEFWNDADGTDWTYPSTTWDDQQDGETYIIQARGRSSDGGHGYNKVERTVKLDANNPTLAISDPVDVKKNKQTSIKGQATDTASGIPGANKIEISIKNLTLGSTYWNGSVWISTTTQQWLQVTSYVNPNWVYSISYPTACWTNGHQYEINSHAWDNVDHLGTLASTQKFWYDVIAPTATLTMPEDGKWYTSMEEINGAVTDNTLDKDPKGTVWLKVQNMENNQYLTQGSTWTASATPIWIQTSFRGTGKTREWYFDTSAVVWANMVDYDVEVYAVDGAVGQPTGPNTQAQPWPTATFTYDDSVPDSTITSLVQDRIYSSGPTLEGTASDEYDNLEEIRVCLKQYIGGSKYWKGGTQFEVGYDTNCWQVATGTTSWEYTGFSDWEDGQRYRFWSKAYDNAGNVEDVPDSNITGDIGGKYFGYDESAP
ncbi:MAG: IPT/TIG domain-containing protein, partial [Elusimicrobiota bacterium]|nr:IPT/TIG domain-containing protein [Elusimicrobiota bacterium]